MILQLAIGYIGILSGVMILLGLRPQADTLDTFDYIGMVVLTPFYVVVQSLKWLQNNYVWLIDRIGSLGERIINWVMTRLDLLWTYIESWCVSVLQWTERFINWCISFVNWVMRYLSLLLEYIESIATWINQWIDWFVDHTTRFVRTYVWPTLVFIFNKLCIWWHILEKVVVKGFQKFVTFCDWILAYTYSLWCKMQVVLASVWKYFCIGFDQVYKALSDLATNIYNVIAVYTHSLWREMQVVLGSVWNHFYIGFGQVFDALSNLTSQIFASLYEMYQRGHFTKVLQQLWSETSVRVVNMYTRFFSSKVKNE